MVKQSEHIEYMNDDRWKSFKSLRKIEARDKSIHFINELISDNFGYSWTKRTDVICGAKGKAGYADLEEAEGYAMNGLKQLNIDPQIADQDLRRALETWQEAVKGLDKTNKKARINADIGAGLYLNIALVGTLLHEFETADKALHEIELHDEFKNSFKKTGEELRAFYNDERTRHPEKM